jgi:hypothetical protein
MGRERIHLQSTASAFGRPLVRQTLKPGNNKPAGAFFESWPENEEKRMARYLYSELASTVDALHTCETKPEQYGEWAGKHADSIDALVREHMPSGSGFDCGTKIDLDASHAEKLVFTTSFHHMNDDGYYDGWTEHTVTVTPSFNGFNLRIGGRNRNDIKEYIHEAFSQALKTELTIVTRDGSTVTA